jgi:hypothetical protein
MEDLANFRAPYVCGVAERVDNALKYCGGNNSAVVVIKVVTTGRLPFSS